MLLFFRWLESFFDYAMNYLHPPETIARMRLGERMCGSQTETPLGQLPMPEYIYIVMGAPLPGPYGRHTQKGFRSLRLDMHIAISGYKLTVNGIWLRFVSVCVNSSGEPGRVLSHEMLDRTTKKGCAVAQMKYEI